MTASITINAPETSPAARLKAAQALTRGGVRDLDAVCEIDLHIHSFYSDGYHSPAGRVWDAWRRNMRAIALTDHDTFDGCLEALDAGTIFEIDVLPGIEFYTNRTGIEIIAWWPLPDAFREWINTDGGRAVLEPIRNAKQTQLAAMMNRVPACMARHGFAAEITPVDVRQYVKNGVSTKGDISVIMWQKYGAELRARGIADDVKEFQARYTTRDEELNVPLDLDMDLSPEAFVRRVRAWGGVPGLSHPTELRKKEGLDNAALADTIERLGAEGLQAVEVDGWRNGPCPETGRHQTDIFLELVQTYNARHPERLPLLCTNGSDDHNQPGEGLELGCGRNRNLRSECGRYAQVEELRKRARFLQKDHKGFQ